MKRALFIIDPQNDFCHPEGSLYIGEKTKEDIENIINLVKSAKYDRIIVTLDSHQEHDISHPVSWIDLETGENPNPFTIIDSSNLHQYRAKNQEDEEWYKQYILELEKNNKQKHCIWPLHCIIGSWGHAIGESLMKALNEVQETQGIEVDYIMKGVNPFTEYYSALSPEVETETCRVNMNLINGLLEEGYDAIDVTGEALSHCVRGTLLDLVKYVPSEKINLFTDCSTSVQGFDGVEKELEEAGITLSTSDTLADDKL